MTDPNTRNLKVLLVDDEAEFLEATSRVLARRGFSVRTAQDGETALKLLEEQLSQLVLLDLKMPGMDGMEVLQRIRQRWPSLPVIILTGHGSPQQAVQAVQEGAFKFISKPFQIDQLREAAQQAIAIAESRRALLGAQEPPRVRVLIVDSDDDYLHSLSFALQRRGMEVTVASDGNEALARLNRQPIDVVLLEAEIPGASAIEVLRHARRQIRAAEVIVISGQASSPLAAEAVREGAFDVLAKPDDVDALIKRIREAHAQLLVTDA